MTKERIKKRIKSVLKQGNWMITTDSNYLTKKHFKWKPIGEWSEVADWEPNPNCEYGIYGQNPNYAGNMNGKQIYFCEVDKSYMVCSDGIKVKRAKILLINELPDGLVIYGNLDISYTNTKSLPKDLKVFGKTNISYTKITSLLDNWTSEGSLDLTGCDIETLPKGMHIKGYLDISDTKIKTLPEDLDVDGIVIGDYDDMEEEALIHILQNDPDKESESN